MKFLVYSNCQGIGIWKALLCIPWIAEKYELCYHANYVPTNNVKLMRDVSEADVILYQPLAATEDILKMAKKDAVVISFPYIYCNWLWPFYINQTKDGAIFYDGGIIRNLRMVSSKRQLLEWFHEGKIDFELQRRQEESLQTLRNKEEHTLIKVADYILENYKSKRLFHMTNHPSHHIYIHCANQVLRALGWNETVPEDASIGEYNDCKFWPIHPYVTKYFQLTYGDNDRSFFENMLKDVLDDFQESYPPSSALKATYFNHMKHDLYTTTS